MILRIPSKLIQYGYIEVDVPTAASPEAAAATYLDWVSRFQVAEQNVAEGNVPEAPTNEMPDATAVAVVKEVLGATEVPETQAPWDEKPPPAETPAWDKPVEFDLFD